MTVQGGRGFRLLLAAAAVLLLADLAIHRHGYLEVEAGFGFYGLFALAAGVTVVLLARLLRRLLGRREDYYD